LGWIDRALKFRDWAENVCLEANTDNLKNHYRITDTWLLERCHLMVEQEMMWLGDENSSRGPQWAQTGWRPLLKQKMTISCGGKYNLATSVEIHQTSYEVLVRHI